jgi:hypothetical protein
MSVKWTSFIVEKRIAIRFVVWQVIAICRGLSIGELQVPNRQMAFRFCKQEYFGTLIRAPRSLELISLTSLTTKTD